MEFDKRLPQLCDDQDCTGCMACLTACNKDALLMTTNEEGFYRPLLLTDKCVMCGLCEKCCPILNSPSYHKQEELKVFAALHKKDEIRRNSSSGGAFTVLAEIVLESGGVVFGASYSVDMHIEHISIENKEELPKLRLSKYAQSKIDNILVSVRDYLKKGRQVLFVGTPCQTAGLKTFLRKDYENLICVDFICHGVPSNDLLQVYLKWLEPKMGKAVHVNFRNKQKGWYDNLRVITNIDGISKTIRGDDDAYWIAYSRNICLQECCYYCKSQGFPRCSDISLADFWRIGHKIPFGNKHEIEKGVSMIIVNNPLVQKVIDKARNKMFMEERTLEEAIIGNLSGVKSSVRPITRETFYKDLNIMSFEQFRLKYMKPSLKENLIKVFRERIPFSVIKFIRLSKQK